MKKFIASLALVGTLCSAYAYSISDVTDLQAYLDFHQNEIMALDTSFTALVTLVNSPVYQADWNMSASSTAFGHIKNQPSLSTVATTGAYADLTGKPTFKRQETYSGTTNGSGIYTVTFGTAYSVAPNIQANLLSGSDTQSSRITAISTTGFTVLIRNRTDVVGLLPSYANVSGASVDVVVTEK